MNGKRVLIVDDEESILSVLKRSIEKLDSNYEVLTTDNGQSALRLLNSMTIDLVVTDYRMAGMNGLELLEKIKSISPSTQVVMITAFGGNQLEAEARKRQAYGYLTKPLEVSEFQNIVRNALGDLAISRPGILVLSDTCYQEISASIKSLVQDIGALSVFLTDVSGHIIVKDGIVEDIPVGEIASLLSGSMAGLTEAGTLLDNDSDTINMTYREGVQHNLYAINVGINLLLIILIEKSLYSSKLGSVWHYAHRTAVKLKKAFEEKNDVNEIEIFDDKFSETLDSDFDKLLGLDDFSEAAPMLTEPQKTEPALPVHPAKVEEEKNISEPLVPSKNVQRFPEKKIEVHHTPVEKKVEKVTAPSGGVELLTYEEAVRRGLISSS